MNFLSRRLAIELSHFQALGENLRQMILSYTFFLMANPLLGIFMSAFFWRQDSGALFIVLYQLGWVLGLPIGFYINGYLLRKIHVKHLYLFGTIFQGVGAALAVFGGTLTTGFVLSYGLIYGSAAGLFWGNKNSLEFRFSRGLNRGYYLHMSYIVNLLANVIMPILIGWLIVFGDTLHWYSADSAYKVFMGLALLLLSISGYFIATSKIETIKAMRSTVVKPSRTWQQVRLFHIIFQLMMGLSFFLPTLLILYFGSKEGVLGTMQSIAAIVSAGVLYILGRKVKIKDAVKVVGLANLVCLLAALFLFWQFSWLGAAVYLICIVATEPIRFSSSYTVIMEVMDGEVGVVDGKTDYAYVADNELFFNLGRTIVILFFLAMMYFSLENALKWVPVIIALVQFLALKPLAYLMNRVLRAKTA